MAGLDPISNVAEATGTIAAAAAKIISLFKTDPNIKAQLQQELDLTALQGQIQEVLAQIQVDTVEAANKSTFVAGWRPFVGWVCGGSLAMPVLIYVVQTLAMIVHGKYELPPFNGEELGTTLIGLLGLGGMRTYEKVNGVDQGNK